jgi:predicted site-specific integrase-resolvase
MQEDEQFVSASNIRSTFAVCNNTLRRLAEKGTVRCVRLGGAGKRLYHVSDVRSYLGASRLDPANGSGSNPRARIVYARVSSKKQEPDLARQEEALLRLYPEHELVRDIASGINFKRRGLTSILERAMQGRVEEVVVAHRDRLCRIAFDLVEHVLRQAGVRLVVLDASESNDGEADAAELQQDLLAIATIFVASNNGKRAARNRRRRREEAAGHAQATGEAEGKAATGQEAAHQDPAQVPVHEGALDTDLSDSEPEGTAPGRL